MFTRLLMIDPDIPFMVSLKQALEGTGQYSVSVSAHALGGVDALRRHRHDIAMLSMEIPDMDMMALIARLRQIQPTLPIVVLPKNTEQQDRAVYLDVQGMLPKPFRARELMEYARSVLAQVARPPSQSDEKAVTRLFRTDQPVEKLDLEIEESPAQTFIIDDALLVEPEEEPDTFGEVLESVAELPPQPPPTPQDRAFHDLVESMRTPAKRTTFDDLLESIAADAAEAAELSGESGPVTDSMLDYVLAAIRRDNSQASPVPDDETIGDVIGKLFDPAFESVLSALAGEDISEYDGGDEESDWITAREGRPTTLPEIYSALIDEPPLNPEDSSGYPATAALNALAQEESEITLDALLDKIEQEFPSKMHPASPDDDDLGSLQAMFSDVIQPQDTQPSQTILQEIENYPVQDADTVRMGLPEDESDIPQMFSMAELLAMADLPADATDEIPLAETDDDVHQAFYEGVRETDYEIIGKPDEDHLIPVPAETAAMMAIQADAEPDPEEELLARIAVQMTQFALESSAQATILSQLGKQLAASGSLPPAAMKRLFEIIDAAWSTSTVESASLIRFVALPDLGDYLLYSAFVEENLILSMVFQSNTPVNVIRRQARRLAESLAFVPEVPEADSSPTWPSRPTDPRKPAGLVIEQPAPEVAPDIAAPVRPARPDTPYVGYTCLWIPADAGLELDPIADDLSAWIHEIAEQNAWDVDNLTIRPDAVLLDISVPTKTLPDHALALLMEDTTRRCAEIAPDLSHLWADGYYVVTPPRPLTEREIASYTTYQRQAQMS